MAILFKHNFAIVVETKTKRKSNMLGECVNPVKGNDGAAIPRVPAPVHHCALVIDNCFVIDLVTLSYIISF